MKQFGCASLEVNVKKIDKQSLDTDMFFSVNKTGCLFIAKDQKVILEGKWDDLEIDFSVGEN